MVTVVEAGGLWAETTLVASMTPMMTIAAENAVHAVNGFLRDLCECGDCGGVMVATPY
jgi:hypothetical protein